jgi:DNA-binding phage protein
MALETIPYDSTDFLDDPGSIAGYVEAAFEDGDPAVITHALRIAARTEGMSQPTRDAGAGRPESCPNRPAAAFSMCKNNQVERTVRMGAL